MAQKIFKYELSIKEKQEIELPIGARIIRVDNLDGKFYLWAMVDIKREGEEEVHLEVRNLEFYKTGQIIEDGSHLIYLGFCKLFIMQELGLYVFENIETKLKVIFSNTKTNKLYRLFTYNLLSVFSTHLRKRNY